VGRPNRHTTNPGLWTAAILKNQTRKAAVSGLTDLHKIWQDDAYSLFEPYWQLKFSTFKNPRWRTCAIW